VSGDTLQGFLVARVQVLDVQICVAAVFGGEHPDQGLCLLRAVPGGVEDLFQGLVVSFLDQVQQGAGHGGLVLQLVFESSDRGNLGIDPARAPRAVGYAVPGILGLADFGIGAGVDCGHVLFQNRVQEFRPDYLRPDGRIICLIGGKGGGDALQHYAVKAAELAPRQNARADLHVDLIVLPVFDVDHARKLALQLVQNQRPVVPEPLIETLLDPF
jgi:hypothetical protein